MEKLKNRRGFTLAEAMLVLAIMTVLMGVAFVAVQNYLRSLTKLEYDGYAKEIFIASQNHLSMAKNLGYLGMEEGAFGTEETDDKGGTGVYYFVVNTANGSAVTDKSALLSLMLPTAAVDETVRLGGKYIIRYRPEDAVVLDVFYWSDSGRYALTYKAEYYRQFRADHSRNALKTFGDKRAVIGWYGGELAALLNTDEALKAPGIVVRNAERLTVTVTDPNENDKLRLIVRGVTSGKEVVIDLTDSNDVNNPRCTSEIVDGKTVYRIVLDDITTSGMHFSKLGGLTPGEDITVQALAEPDGELRAPAYSPTATTNSLFGDSTVPDSGKAEIADIRHLENLSKEISDVNGSEPLYSKAEQTVDLNWTEFKEKINPTAPGDVCVYPQDNGPATEEGCFMPVTPGYVLQYDGQKHKIRDVQVNDPGDAGLFGTLTGEGIQTSSVSNLMLVDFNIAGGTRAGALAGSVLKTEINNVVAYNTGGGTNNPTVSGSGSVGGLIGSVTGSSVTNSAAALVVSGGNSTGGLIGSAGDVAVIGCYAGAHTEKGGFVRENGNPIYNVRGSGSTGGLIGTTTVPSGIKDSYSTCSVSGGTAGGLVGTASGVIENCYSVGLVEGTNKGGFIGSSAASCSGCAYLDIASYYAPDVTKYEAPGATGSGASTGIVPMDESPETYSLWSPLSTDAEPYDTTLKGNYPYVNNVPEGVFAHDHYGDWPGVDTNIINIY